MVNLTAIRIHVVGMLNAGLSPDLTYHNVQHTLDVARQCLAIAKGEGIRDKQQLQDLQVAALYHDTGFIYVYQEHEQKSCEIAREHLPGFGVSDQSIETICGIIMATRIPQTPHNELEKIICDADLDYLGRKGFFGTGDSLRRELITYKLITGEHDWEERQLDFLQKHQYFTETSRQKRSPAKQRFIKQLIKHQDSNDITII